MDARPEPRPSRLPTPRGPDRPPALSEAAGGADPQVLPAAGDPHRDPPATPPGGSGRDQPRWRRLTRTVRGAAGLAIGAAALLLWPFSGWSWIPWLAGLGLLVVLRLLRLDGLLRGWVLHLGGLAVVVGLMLSTGPWDWALAASIGVLLAGLAQLPWWRLAAVGAVLCLVSGTGFGFSSYRSAQEVAAEQAQTSSDNRGRLGAPRATGVLPALLNRIATGSPAAVCDNLLAEQARAPFAASVAQPDCPAAVRALSAQVLDPVRYANAEAPSVPSGDGLQVDACSMTWASGAPAGPQLGHLTVGRASGSTYVVTAFARC